MSKVDTLIANFREFIKTPWQDVAPDQRVIFCVYDPSDERHLQTKIDEFELAARHVEHGWVEFDLTGRFEQWLASEKYSESYFANPELMETVTSQFLKTLVEQFQQIVDDKADSASIVCLRGVGTLFGLLKVKAVIDAIAPHVPGRLLVFFPGSFDNNNYRLLDAYDGWNYLAVALTSDKAI